MRNTDKRKGLTVKDNATILLNTINITDGDEDVIELQTQGKFAERDGKYFISYEETELTGFDDTTTSIFVSNDKVNMSRKGKYNMKMTYKPGEKNLCYYDTFYGSIIVAVDTKKIVNNLTPDGGSVMIDFLLDADNTTFAHNKLTITVQKD